MTAVELQKRREKTDLGFWLYIMTDLMLFATLFATFMVLRHATAGGPDGAQLFDPSYALLLTVVLLTSSFTAGIALLSIREKRVVVSKIALVATIVLGVAFLGLELYEFNELLHEGYSWQTSAFLSSFFTLVATHGLHIFFGIVWAIVLLAVMAKRGISEHLMRRFGLYTVYWHFLDLVWIFIFVIVYLIGGAV